ncbi:hypothetical protein BU15DRAFT_79682 [Melanogaster broomeanus]|nr:hypothetical protein BU15DRAFT_79682 [Melanogaster broomeanus]
MPAIVIQVVDVCDPGGCRRRLLGEAVRRRGGGKKLVFAHNFLDLLPSENAQQGLRDTPQLFSFLSASSKQPSNQSSDTATTLVRLLKACKSSEAQSVPTGNRRYGSRVPQGLLSNLINSLRQSKPEHTKDMQIQLEHGVRVIDSSRGVRIEDQDDSNISQSARTLAIHPKRVTAPEDGGSETWTTEIGVLSLPHHKVGATQTQRGEGVPNGPGKRKWTTTTEDPVFLCATAIPSSSMPSTVPGTGVSMLRLLVTKTVGQAPMLTKFSKPFELVELLDAAHATQCQNQWLPKTEKLKKDREATELPNLEVRTAQKQKARSFWMSVTRVSKSVTARGDSKVSLVLLVAIFQFPHKPRGRIASISIQRSNLSTTTPAPEGAASRRHRAEMMAAEETRTAEYLRKHHPTLPTSELQTAQA